MTRTDRSDSKADKIQRRGWHIVLMFTMFVVMVIYGSLAWTRFLLTSESGVLLLSLHPVFRPIGPTSERFRNNAANELRLASATLADTSIPAGRAVAVVLQHYDAAIDSLQSSLRSCPLDVKAAAMLAAVGWEASGLGRRGAVQQDWLGLIRVASSISPRDPEVLFSHGRLLLSMGDRDGAISMLKSCVQLSPEYGARAVDALLDAGEPLETIASTFPDNSEALVSLSKIMFSRRLEADFIQLSRGRLQRASSELLAAFGYACLRSDAAATLRDTLERVDREPTPDAEAERLIQLARAELSVGSPRVTLDLAIRAIRQMPNSVQYNQASGEIELTAGYPAEALKAFNHALELAARDGAPPDTFAGLYADIARCQRQLGLADEAVDADRRANSASQQAQGRN
jgi:tetratricopeptide (TPR) repeat protein